MTKMKTLKEYFDNQQLKHAPFSSVIIPQFMRQARKNLQIMRLLNDVQKDEGTRERLNIPDDLNTHDWIIITGYYGMYMASQAALAKINITSKSHAATIAALDTYYVKKKLIDKKYLVFLKNAELEKEHIQQLKTARQQRETVQYDPSHRALEKIAAEILENSYQFVNKIDEILTPTETNI
jgi:uncharacterized protein (UPF0332 family)